MTAAALRAKKVEGRGSRVEGQRAGEEKVEGRGSIIEGQSLSEKESGSLDAAILDRIVDAAIGRWAKSGAEVERLRTVRFAVSDLADDYLGLAAPGVIWIDRDAAGYGWFVDETPTDNSEFVETESGCVARPESSAFEHIDLLTVLEHELGHVLGLEHSDGKDGSHHLMELTLAIGVRELASALDIDSLLASEDWEELFWR